MTTDPPTSDYQPGDEPEPDPARAERPDDDVDGAVDVQVTWALDVEEADSALISDLRQHLSRACRLLDGSRGQLSLVLIDDEQMVRLHGEFKQAPQTTDVLTFDLGGEGAEALDAEIYVCVDEARRRASELGHPVGHELLLYAVHGLLHLVGYDDHEPAGYRRMHEAEDRLLQRLGFGRVFHAEGGGESF